MEVWRYPEQDRAAKRYNRHCITACFTAVSYIGHQKGGIRKVKLSLSTLGVELWLQPF